MRTINRLSAKTVAAIQDPGLHADGGGLYLRIDHTLNRRWVFVFFWAGKRREMGLGSALPNRVSLKDARDAADDARSKVQAGTDPITARKAAARAGETFGDVATRVIDTLATAWRGERTELQWRQSLEDHATRLWRKPVAEVTTEDVLAALKPIWMAKAETARRVRMRIERVVDVAKVEGLYVGENPARWNGHLKLLLPDNGSDPIHHTAMDYEEMPRFLGRLRGRPATAARALEFLILGVNRTGEVLGATWAEIEGNVWVIPKERMKMAREHRVPITPRMREILDEMEPLRTKADLIFPGDQRIEPLSNMAMAMLLRRMDIAVTVHGFRSTFRDWAGDCTEHPRDLIETALAHQVGDDVERAYRRRDALVRRRAVMLDWERYCTTPPAANVVPIRA